MRKNFLRILVLFAIITLTVAMAEQTVKASTIQNVKTWRWTGNTQITSVARGDVDGDGKTEIVTGGYYYDGVRDVAQLCVWDGATLALENVKTWYWTSVTHINAVVVSDVNGDGKNEIVTGGYYFEGTGTGGYFGQLCIWDGSTLALENVKTWRWTSTEINAIAVGDVDRDGKSEIITAGTDSEGNTEVAQLCVWDGATLALENVKTWYWISHTGINSVAIGDVDGDGKIEIVTGGDYYDGTKSIAQLCVWDGSTLALENVKTWQLTNYFKFLIPPPEALSTHIYSVALDDVDGDGKIEIVTGGYYFDNTRPDTAQLCVWDGATLALKNVMEWNWGFTHISAVAVGDVDGDGKKEIVTGGSYVGSTYVAQLCIWDGSTLTLKDVTSWYWTSSTFINSIAVGDVNGDGKNEIVTGGYHSDTFPLPTLAQLCVWNGT